MFTSTAFSSLHLDGKTPFSPNSGGFCISQPRKIMLKKDKYCFVSDKTRVSSLKQRFCEKKTRHKMSLKSSDYDNIILSNIGNHLKLPVRRVINYNILVACFVYYDKAEDLMCFTSLYDTSDFPKISLTIL